MAAGERPVVRPVGGRMRRSRRAGGVALTVDGFNLVGTASGVYDHALVLVDPKGTVTTDASGIL